MSKYFVTINKIDRQGHITKHDIYPTEIEAQNRIVELHGMGLTDAFYLSESASTINGHRCYVEPAYWTADPAAKTVTLDEVALNTKINAEETKEFKKKRQAAYVEESDSLFFQEQSGDADTPVGTWAAKRAEIKAKYPKPELN
jgi:hypothetical protein